MDDDRFAAPPDPPYTVSIFASRLRPGAEGYPELAARMVELARQQEGFLGMESARDATGFGITVSYWRDEECVARWRAVAEHAEAQRRGRRELYERFEMKLGTVARAKSFRR